MAVTTDPQKQATEAPREERKGTGFLSRIDIANFRGIKKLSLTLDETTVLIGENNTSKTSILDAIQLCLSRTLRGKAQIFSEYDYHLVDKKSQPIDSDPIEIILYFAEAKEGDWADEIVQVLAEGIQGSYLRTSTRLVPMTSISHPSLLFSLTLLRTMR